MKEKFMAWRMARELGYNPITTFWDDFTIAEPFGEAAIKDTAKRAFNEWKHDYKYLTELIMVLNHKAWECKKFSELYSNLYYKYDRKAIEYLEKDEEAIHYYFKTLD